MSNSEAHTASPAASEKRQPRQSRLVKASLGCERLSRFDITIRNVSRTGVGGKGSHRLHIGERVTLFLPAHPPLPATVRRVENTRFGIEPDDTIETERLRTATADRHDSGERARRESGSQVLQYPGGGGQLHNK